MVAYHDHTEHDVDVIATEQGIADIRGITPKEREKAIIENCVHPDFKKAIWDYCNGAGEKNRQHTYTT